MTVQVHGFTANEALKTWQFRCSLVGVLREYHLWHRPFGSGLSHGAGCSQDVTRGPFASMVGIIRLNGFGRIAWSTVSDYIGRGWTYVIFFAIEISAFCEAGFHNRGLHVPGFGSFDHRFATAAASPYMPAYLSDIFGTSKPVPSMGVC